MRMQDMMAIVIWLDAWRAALILKLRHAQLDAERKRMS